MGSLNSCTFLLTSKVLIINIYYFEVNDYSKYMAGNIVRHSSLWVQLKIEFASAIRKLF